MSNSLIRRGLDLLSDDLQHVKGKGTGTKKSLKTKKTQKSSKARTTNQKQKSRNTLKNKKLKSTQAIYDSHRKMDNTDDNLSVINYMKLIDTGSSKLINKELRRHSKKMGIPLEKSQHKSGPGSSSTFTDRDFNDFLNDFDFGALKTAADADGLVLDD